MSSLNRIPLPPLDMLTGYRRHQSILSSSPIRSSSPPRTPYLPGYGHYQPCIQSSPLVDVNVELPPLRYRADDPPSILAKFGRKIDNHLPASLKQASIGRASYFDTEEDLPPSSEFEVEEHAEDAEMGLPELDSAGESTPGHEVPSLSFSDSDSEQHINKTITNKPSEPKENDADEGEEEEEGFDFGNGGWRATFFRVSEERGKWKDDPVALKPTTTAGLRRKRLSRQSMPALSTSVQSQVSSVGPSSIATRTISEPLVSLQNACDGSTPGSDHSDLTLAGDVDMERCEGEVSNLDAGLAQPKQDREPSLSLVSQVTPSSSKHASPGLDVDRQEEDGYQEAAPLSRDHEDEEEAMEDSEELSPATASYGNGNGYSSPLPPSSPPLSPMSGYVLSLSRSVSPLSFLPSSPSSSVRGLDFDEDDFDDVALQVSEEGEKTAAGDDDAMADDEDDDKATRPINPSHARRSSLFGGSSAAWLLHDVSPRRTSSSRAHSTGDATQANRDADDVDMELSGGSAPSPPGARPSALLSGPAANISFLPSPLTASISLASTSSQITNTASTSVSAPAATTTSKVKGKHVRRESQGSEKENASVRSRGKMMSAGTATGAKKRKNGSVGDGAVESASGVSRPVKKRKVENGEETKAKKTKSKATAEEECEAKKQPAAKSKSSSKGKGKEKASQDVDVDMDVTEDVQASSSSKPKQRRKPKAVREEDGDEETPAAPSTSKTASSSSKTAPPKPKTTSRKRKAPTTSTEPSDPEPFDDEMTGMLIEVLATSRASSLAVSVLCKSVLQAHPYLKDGAEPAGDSNEENGAFQGEGQEGTSKDAGAHPDGGLAEAGKQSCPYPYLKNRKSDKAWKGVVQRVLAAGSVEGGGSGVFGKVDSSGKDDSDRPLESQWFYVPECDADQDRAMLLRSLMPRPAKRSETKKYKQYYWRPLDKISRWDREDDL